MKIRLDYVTNSSSSSYIVMHKKENIPSQITNEYPYLNVLEKFVENILGTPKMKTLEDLDKYFKDEYIYGDQSLEKFLDDDCYLKKLYNDYKEKISKGYVIYILDFEYNDSLEDMLDKIHDGKTFIVTSQN